MTTIEEALRTLVTTSAAFVQLGGLGWYPNLVPQNAKLPAVAYQVISTHPAHSHSGPVGLIKRNFQFTIDARSYAEVKKMSCTLRQVLDGYRGTVDGVVIGAILWQNENDGYFDESEITTVRQDYMIEYQE